MLGDGKKEVSIVSVVYPCGTVVVHHWNIFRMFVLLLNLLILICLSLSEHATFNSISRRTGGGNENSLSHIRRRPDMRSG